MGPRSNDRGNMDRKFEDVKRLVASMGPRSNDRGNKPLHHHIHAGVSASMGPRSNDRGNSASGRRRTVTGDMLQWGRDQMIAEIRIFFGPTRLRKSASMGPRSNDRGNAH